MIQERTELVLAKTVEEYICSGVPVGSKVLLDKYNFSCSSATIRQEMNVLGDNGFLTQPHVSSGRVPTSKGYRYYVDMLKATELPSLELSSHILVKLQTFHQSVHTGLGHIADIVTTMVDYPVVSMIPQLVYDSLEAVHLVLLDMNRVLLVMLTAIGEHKEVLCEISQQIDQETLTMMSKVISERVHGQPVSVLKDTFFDCLEGVFPNYSVLLDQIGGSVKGFVELSQDPSVQVMGASKILDMPDFSNKESVRDVMSLLESTVSLMNLFEQTVATQSKTVFIGSETGLDELSECSVVMAPCRIDDKVVGAIGFLGPIRMRYDKVLSLGQAIQTVVSDVMGQDKRRT